MRIKQVTLLAVISASIFAAGCIEHVNVQCVENSNCDLSFGGVCTTAPTGNQWCAYPDPQCPSGYRYMDFDVGDGVSDVCVAVAGTGVEVPPPGPSLSCVALPHTCGASSNDDCCTSLGVPGGAYYRSYDSAGDSSSGDMNSPATISSFRLDKYEVTVGRFRAFVADGQGTQAKHPMTGAGAHPNIPGSGWEASWNANLPADTATFVAALKGCHTAQTWTDMLGANEDLPINCITWYEALAFCAWDGGYLPTEAEWNYAAAGGDQQRAYPWSTPANSVTIDGSYASFTCYGCGAVQLTAVGAKPVGDGRWGHSDLASNVSEWTLDWDGAYGSSCTDCANLIPTYQRISRGGAYEDGADVLRTGYRSVFVRHSPDASVNTTGVRCARVK